jgi:hypothetical protein
VEILFIANAPTPVNPFFHIKFVTLSTNFLTHPPREVVIKVVLALNSGYTRLMRANDEIRDLIATEAAKLMYEDGVREYRDAKRKAAKRFGPEKALSLGSHLPSNSEIHEELAKLIANTEEDGLPERLLRLRMTALSYLELFSDFSPYLVGSVLSGAVTSRSDIDIHLFADSIEEVENLLLRQGIPFQTETVPIRKGGVITDYTHIYMEDEGTEIECSVYPVEQRRNRTVSSITGKPMERTGAARLRKLIADSLGVEDGDGKP